nr:hypothetical protein [Tanacetum cinerariifolium]
MTPPSTHVDTTSIPIVSPTITPSPDYTPASPDYTHVSPDYSSTYNMESDLSEDPSLDHIPPLPATSPFLSLTDDSSNNDIPDTPPSPTHGTPFTETTLSTQRLPAASDSSSSSSSKTSSDSSADVLSDYVSSCSSLNHSLLAPSSDRGIDARVVVEVVDRDEVEMGARGPVEVRVDRVTHPVTSDDILEPAQEEGAAKAIKGALGAHDVARNLKPLMGNDRNRNGGNGNGNGNGGGNGYNFKGFMPPRECTYQDFLKCQPLSFNGTKIVVGLTRWFKKMKRCSTLAIVQRSTNQMNKSDLNDVHVSESQMIGNSLIDSHESDGEDNQVNDRFKKSTRYHAVPPPYIGNYMPPRADLSFVGLDDFVFKFAINKIITSVNETETNSEDKNVVEKTKVKKIVKPSLEKIEFVNARNTTVKNESKAEKARKLR